MFSFIWAVYYSIGSAWCNVNTGKAWLPHYLFDGMDSWKKRNPKGHPRVDLVAYSKEDYRRLGVERWSWEQSII